MHQDIYEKIIAKKEFSELPKLDVEGAWKHFEKRQTSEEEKIKLTRDLLRKVFSAFSSGKLLNIKNKNAEWILKKHLSTRERLDYYNEIYHKIFSSEKKITIIDLGAGVNGFSYKYMNEINKKIKYFAIESVGQLVDLTNNYFQREKISAEAIHLSLFELSKIKEFIKKQSGEKIFFLFKVIDSLEMIERDYSKKLLKEIIPLADKVVISFATESLISRKKFRVNRNWIRDFLTENFKIMEEFQLGPEFYLIVQNK